MNRANLMLTRKCNLKCEACGVINHKCDEMDTKTVIKAITVLENCGVKFISIYGGEPTLRDDLPEIVRHLNSIGMNYSIITNSVRLIHDDHFFNRLMHEKPKGITCSTGTDTDGEELLKKLIDNGYKGEMTAAIAVTTNQIHEIPKMLCDNSEREIGSILYFIHTTNDPREWYYRGIPQYDYKELTQSQVERLACFILSNYQFLKMRNSKRYFYNWSKYAISKSWKCNSLSSLQVNADGKVAVCQDKKPLDLTIFDFIKHGYEIETIFNKQIEECSGCFYDCYFENDNTNRLEQ